MKITKDRLLNFLTDLSLAYELPPLIEKVEEVIEALQNEELEIEGYERKDHFRDAAKMVDEWTKFEPDDPTTFPKEGTPVLFISYNPIDKWGMLAEIASDDVIDNWKNISRLFSSVFWREVKFPQPPVETETER